MEDYKVITDYPIYGVSRNGKIKNLTTNKIMSETSHSRNHIVVTLRNNGVVKLLYVHRLVALAYLENPNNYPFVDHIDQNPLNNNISNLRWASVSMNTRNTSKKRRGNIFNVKLKGGGILF